MQEWEVFYGTGHDLVQCVRLWGRCLHRDHLKNIQNDRQNTPANGIGLQRVANRDGIGNIAFLKGDLPDAAIQESTDLFVKFAWEL